MNGYQRGANFGNAIAGSLLNDELDNIAKFSRAVIGLFSLLLRDDNELKDGFVKRHALHQEVFSLLENIRKESAEFAGESERQANLSIGYASAAKSNSDKSTEAVNHVKSLIDKFLLDIDGILAFDVDAVEKILSIHVIESVLFENEIRSIVGGNFSLFESAIEGLNKSIDYLLSVEINNVIDGFNNVKSTSKDSFQVETVNSCQRIVKLYSFEVGSDIHLYLPESALSGDGCFFVLLGDVKKYNIFFHSGNGFHGLGNVMNYDLLKKRVEFLFIDGVWWLL